MKHVLILSITALLATTVANADSADFADDSKKLSYSLGIMLGERVIKRYGEVDYDLIMEAMKAQAEGTETRISLDDAAAELQAFEKKAESVKIEEAKKGGEEYLAANQQRSEVSVTESGLQWEILSQGDGEKPQIDDTVSVHYVGTLIDGTKFDSSLDRGQPASFPLKGVIPGWTEGLQLMNVGSKYRFVIPANLAYGDRGAGQAIGPGETLVFEVELLEIKKEP